MTAVAAPDPLGTYDKEFALSYLGCSLRTLRELTRKREIGFVRNGKEIRFRGLDLIEYNDAHRIKSKAELTRIVAKQEMQRRPRKAVK